MLLLHDALLAPLHCTSAWLLFDSCYKLPQLSTTAGEATDGPQARKVREPVYRLPCTAWKQSPSPNRGSGSSRSAMSGLNIKHAIQELPVRARARSLWPKQNSRPNSRTLPPPKPSSDEPFECQTYPKVSQTLNYPELPILKSSNSAS